MQSINRSKLYEFGVSSLRIRAIKNLVLEVLAPSVRLLPTHYVGYRSRPVALIVLCLGLTVGCATNPVTGARELGLVSAGQEVAIGRQQYQPAQQMQGGPYNADPELTAYVQRVGRRVAAHSDRDLPYEFVVINDSTPNAWALPGGKIAINRGLLWELRNEAELAAVLGHEVVHAAARHGAKSMERGMLTQGALLVSAIALSGQEYQNLALGGAQLAAQLVTQKYGRDAELESDRYGIRYMHKAGYDPRAAVTLQETFVRLNGERRSNWLDGLFASHPPSPERVANNQRIVAGIPPGGELGEARYQAALDGLVSQRQAYELHDQGRRALAAGDAAKALQLGRAALNAHAAAERESLFHGLVGEALASQNRHQQALPYYREAIRRQPEFFAHQLRYAQSLAAVGAHAEAEQALLASQTLLPTAEGQLALGYSAMRQGDRAAALERFGALAEHRSAAGQRAAQEFVRLDLPANPQRYVGFAVRGTVAEGQVLQIQNKAPLDMGAIRFEVIVQDASGGQRVLQDALPKLAAGSLVSRRISAGLAIVNARVLAVEGVVSGVGQRGGRSEYE